ncbi:MAG: BatA domain-containing protein [Elusimicrobiota bacterium]
MYGREEENINLTFIKPSFLWFSLFAGIPLLIHLLNRKPVKHIEFPTLRFILPSSSRILKRYQLFHLLVLLLRMLIIVLLTVAYAGPVWKGYSGAGSEIKDHIILIDNSYSMDCRISTGEKAIELAKKTALKLTADLKGRFAVATFNEGLEYLYPFSDDRNTLHEYIEKTVSSGKRTDTIKAIHDSVEALEDTLKESGVLNFIILSDFTDDGFMGEIIKAHRPGMHFLMIDICDASKNAWIERTDIPVFYRGIRSSIKSGLNSSDAVKADIGLEINGVSRNTKTIEFSGKEEVNFSYTFDRKGMHACLIRMETLSSENDRIDIDNAGYFHIDVREKIRVLIVDGEPGYTLMGGESYFIARALAPGDYDTPVSARIINAAELTSINTADYDILLLLNVKISKAVSEAAEKFSSSGKGVCLFLGSNVENRPLNIMLSSLMPVDIISRKPVEVKKITGLTASGIFKDVFPVGTAITLNNLFSTQAELPEKPQITAGGYPLLWIYSGDGLNRGNSALFTSTPDMDWSDFPLNSTFPAFVHELIKYLAGNETSRGEYRIAGLSQEPGNKNTNGFPEKRTLPVKIGTLPGNYPAIAEHDTEVISVNLDSSTGESALRQADITRVKKYLNADIFEYIPCSTDLYDEILKKVTGKEKSLPVLITVFMLLLFEEILRKYLKSHES